jgi:hypothetical protein
MVPYQNDQQNHTAGYHIKKDSWVLSLEILIQLGLRWDLKMFTFLKAPKVILIISQV